MVLAAAPGLYGLPVSIREDAGRCDLWQRTRPSFPPRHQAKLQLARDFHQNRSKRSSYLKPAEKQQSPANPNCNRASKSRKPIWQLPAKKSRSWKQQKPILRVSSRNPRRRRLTPIVSSAVWNQPWTQSPLLRSRHQEGRRLTLIQELSRGRCLL